MAVTILKGTIVSARSPEKPDITENGYLIAENGVITGVFPTLPEQYAGAPVEDWGNALILQSFADLHLHAPQYPMLGMGMDLPLLEWLNTYTFPAEARFADSGYARTVYRQLARELAENGTTRVCMFSSLHTDATLILMEELERAGVTGYVGKVNMDRMARELAENGTTRVCMFSSLHTDATLILMEELERAGVTGYVGKVNMDRNGAPGLLQETTEESRRETLRWLEACGDFRLVKPILTPRFTPSCTDELMAFLGGLAAKQDLPVQSHLSENQAEMAWVRELHPDCLQYWESYAKYGLWNSRTLMAHCVWSDQRERAAMKEAGVTAVHCADSNQNLCSGTAPVRTMLREGVRVALGSDIAGGDHLSMFDVTAAAIRASKARRIMDDWEPDFLTVPEGWYLATSAGAAYFGEQPGFAAGNPLHAIVLQDDRLPQSRPLTVTVPEGWYLATSAGAAYFGEQPGFAAGNPLHAIVLQDDRLPQSRPLTAAERLERCVYRRQPDAIRAVFSAGRKVYTAG